MLILLARLVVNILANAVGLAAAAVILEDFSIHGTAFAVAVLIFSLAVTVLGPLTVKIAMQNAPYLMGGIALVTTFVGLVLTNAFSGGISIHGATTWVLATFIIWVFSLIANLLLPLLVFKKTLSHRKAQKGSVKDRPMGGD